MKKTALLFMMICTVCFSNETTVNFEPYSFTNSLTSILFQESPPDPVGFIASDNIGGNPVNEGEAFLACGPNNVGDENIEYRLFYALSSDNVSDPLTAAEYNFGDTAGDGGGTSAFGFVISGLNPGVEYTFWLYQYNSSTGLYSGFAEVSTVTGGASGPEPDQADGFNADQAGIGEASLSCGPNDVADADIEYRLFYALSSDNVSDPLTATEYTFGSTAGDGGGNNAFDFVISGLDTGVEYTFWLYQYNTSEELYSEPTEASVVINDGSASSEPEAPVGFIAADNIGGNPVNAGEAFLACGPNDVADADIEYRLFYARTEDAVTDPLTATGYNFGDTGGDGGGNNAFGFVISGLDPGVEYTFWLYQYNTSAGLYSDSAEVSVTTGGDSGVEPPVNEVPEVAAPTPTEDGTNVISMYSDAYTDVTVDTWLTPWSSGQLEDLQIEGNPTKRYYNLDFIGAETVANPIDASEMDYIHLDVWSPNATVFRVKLVDLGNGAVEGELPFTIAQNEWVSLEIPLEDFADPDMVTNPANLLTVRNSLQQLILSGMPTGDLEVYVDNIYFGQNSDSGNETYTYENGNWTPEAPFGVSTIADEIVIANGSVDFNQAISANNLTVNTDATVNVYNTLFINSTMTNNGSVVFKSTTNSFGQLAEFNGNISGDGSFQVERYIPANRSFRFVTSGVDSDASIFVNWQENGNSPAGFGTHITGSTDGSNGFDITETGNPSLFDFENASQSWSAVSNTDVNTLSAGTPYRLYVRGDRNIDLTTNDAESETTLRATGDLVSGDVLMDNLSQTGNDFSFIGNPYQATVDMSSLTFNNVESGFYWVWDPNVNDDGAYVVVDLSDGTNPSTSQANQYLQPGQAAFVKTLTDGSASVTFNEASKNVNEVSNAVFSENNEPKLNLRLYESQSLQNGDIAYDAIGIRFNANASNDVTHQDAPKMGNPAENLARLENDNFLSIENRQLPETNDELSLAVYNYNHTNYTFEADLSDFDDNTNVYLNDNYTESQTLLENGLNYIEFSVDASIPESVSMNRFSISVENTTLSIPDENFENFSVYPNPVTNQQFTIQSGQLSGQNANLKLYNISGQVVLTRTVKADHGSLQIQTNGLSSGIYILELTQGQQTFKEKLIIK